MRGNVNLKAYNALTRKQTRYIEIKISQGLKDTEISKIVEVSTATISRWKQTEHFQKGFDEFQAEFFKGLVPEAMRTVRDLLRSENERVKLEAAKDILNRSNFNPVTRLEIEQNDHRIYQEIRREQMEKLSEEELRRLVALDEPTE